MTTRMALAGGLLVGTLVSEDAAALTAGSLVASGTLPVALALGAIFLGIWLGDAALFLCGRRLRPWAARWPRAARWLADPRVVQAAAWLDRRAWYAMAVTRVTPGTRLPTYLAAGLSGMSWGRFLLCTGVVGLAWTPFILAIGAGSTWMVQASGWLPAGPVWPWLLGLMAGLFILIHVLRTVIRLWPRRHHEWWPAWMLYLPMIPCGVLLALRYRSWRAPLLANPALPDSGIVGESKAAILSRLTGAPVLPWCLLPAAAPAQRYARLQHWMVTIGTTWPVILKPDAGERGAGVRLVRDAAAATAVLAAQPGRLLAQVFHPGPIEIGIFWTRRPGRSGRILAITSKHFPDVAGDGQRTLAELIRSHPRLALQEAVFAARWQQRWDWIPQAGERVRLAQAGNHCQGCCFRDGAHLITPALTASVARWMHRVEGLHFGRFDVRAPSLAAVQAGRDLGIIELNGLTSEPTNLYDPDRSPWFAWRLLFRAWNEAWAIGARERRRGVMPPTLVDVLRRVRREAQVRRGLTTLAD